MSTKNATLYDTDFYAWTAEQAALLRAGRLSEADVENIAEEIESMGRSERRELVSRLTVLFVHLLKWRLPTDAARQELAFDDPGAAIQLGRHFTIIRA